MAATSTDPALPGWFRPLGVPLAGILLVLFFGVRGFPYDVVSNRIRGELEPALGARLQIGNLGPALQWAGPALEATDVRLISPDLGTLRFDRVLIRPAWSTAWLRGRPAFHAELEGEAGSLDGSFEVGTPPAGEGRIHGLRLAELPLDGAFPGGDIQGLMDASFALRGGELGAEGPVRFEVRDGSLALPDLPVALPFSKLSGELELGGAAFVTIASLTLEGPIASGSGSGSIAKAPSFAQAPLQMQFDLNVKPALAGGARSAGLRVDRDGNTVVRVSGTVASPQIR